MKVLSLLERDPIIEKIIESAAETEAQVYLVGGFVRDLLRGIRSKDYDIAILGDVKNFTLTLVEKLKPLDFRFYPFFTSTILGDVYRIDIAHLRRETYPSPAALPVVEKTFSIYEDLRRRDFTINAMAITLTEPDMGELIDPFEGFYDLKMGFIKTLKSGSFKEDPTRAFRAIRYKVRLSFNYHPSLHEEFELARFYVRELTFDRIKTELVKIGEEELRGQMWEEVMNTGLLHAVFPVKYIRRGLLKELSEFIEGYDGPNWLCFLIASTENFSFLLEKNLTREERKLLEDYVRIFKKKPVPQSLREAHQCLRWASDLSILLYAFLHLEGEERELLRTYVEKRKGIKVHLSGEELLNMGVEGPEIGKIKNLLFQMKLDGKLKTLDEEKEFVLKYLRKLTEEESS